MFNYYKKLLMLTLKSDFWAEQVWWPIDLSRPEEKKDNMTMWEFKDLIRSDLKDWVLDTQEIMDLQEKVNELESDTKEKLQNLLNEVIENPDNIDYIATWITPIESVIPVESAIPSPQIEVKNAPDERLQLVRSLIKRYRNNEDYSKNEEVVSLYKEAMKPWKTPMDRLKVFKAAMDAVDTITEAKTTEQVEVVAEELSPEVQAVFDELNNKPAWGDTLPVEAGKRSSEITYKGVLWHVTTKTDFRIKLDNWEYKTVNLTEKQVVDYNEIVDKKNALNTDRKEKEANEPSLWDKITSTSDKNKEKITIVDTKEKTNKESSIFDKVSDFFSSDESKESEKVSPKEATAEEFEDYLQKEFRNMGNLKIRDTKPQITAHWEKNAMTHPIPLKEWGTAEMTPDQVKKYNILAKNWTELRKK